MSVQQQDRSATWNSIIAPAFFAKAYTQALYRPAGCWVDVISTTPLAADMAAYLYPGSNEAFIVEAQLNNLGENTTVKTFAKHYFIVPSTNPLKPSGDYLVSWSEEDFAYIVRNRVKTTEPVNCDNGWAFDHFNFDYGLEEQEDDDVASDTASIENNDISDDNSGKAQESNTSEEDTDKTEDSNVSEGETEKTEHSTATDPNARLSENISENEKEDKRVDSIKSEAGLTNDTTTDSDSVEHLATTDNSKSTESDGIGKLSPSIQSWIDSAVGRDWADIDEEDQEEDLASDNYTVSVVDKGCTTPMSTPTPYNQKYLTSDLDTVSIVDDVHIIRPNTPTPRDKEEDLLFDIYTASSMDEVCIKTPNFITPYNQESKDQDGDKPTVNLPSLAPLPSVATLAPISDEPEDEEIEDSSSEEDSSDEEELEENNPETGHCVQITDTFGSYEADFWRYMYTAPNREANPEGQLCYENYQEPPGDYFALSYACYPQNFKSITSAATSLWAVTSMGVSHRMHGDAKPFSTKHLGVPFSRQSVLAAQACKTINPIRYDGPGYLLENHVGSKLQDAVTGYAHNTFLPIGRHMYEPVDPANPRALHLPIHAHWSILTVPRIYLTPPYIFDHHNPDHHLPPGLPGGTGKSKKRAAPKKASRLSHMKLCYEAEEVAAITVANKTTDIATETIIKPTSTEQPSSQNEEEDHGAPELLSWYTTPIEQDAYELDVISTMLQSEEQQESFPTKQTDDSLVVSHQAKAKAEAAKDADVSLTTTTSELLQKLKADLKQELKEELLEGALREELKQELKTELMAELKANTEEPTPKSDDNNTTTTSKTITTRSPSSGSFLPFGESLMGSVTWTAAGTALLAIGVVAAVFRGLRR
ncbi:MAG: hypothetical protein GOMPHAMPRED_007082 [Gomphillus americanus]|uniref:Uncharacterized protein n=1 Tax=Gomphillus americanus TaxID=1940652 RepID=A0A8H3IBW2_9LECA|nr:MAG: hypothetical protein GOMPHAMPRED_007082 [Gomphillus americanus]